MRRSSLAIVAIATLGLATLVHAQQRGPAPAPSTGVNVGSLSCNVAGGAGFVFGSSKALSCILRGPTIRVSAMSARSGGQSTPPDGGRETRARTSPRPKPTTT